MFCYTGGFSFYAMRGGAKLVHSVDSSAKAIDLTNKNVELNFPGCLLYTSFRCKSGKINRFFTSRITAKMCIRDRFPVV